MMTDRNKDLLFCALAIVAALSVLVASFSYQSASAYFPQLLAVFIAVLAVVLGLQRLKAPAEPVEKPDHADLLGFAKVVISILAYTGAMLVVGFPIATVLFLTLMMLTLGERRLHLILPVALGLTGLLYFLFFWFLGVYPPEAMISF
ncbi:hypothetical protein GCM10016455_09000 [Aliiroseovarius zhejiangensis]|uniref:DUF1468 domain-containing protein n=1 Tax=Aliiroseovarius zhejiangensis TaxID=1632025 RepID=A0ABQ3IRS7_9RHOB|nr:tripartite tricarboxylate transporter TctB family protein [Aliiroseovarius zhejiangensis]GHE90793.1 hypothetical protein GCM10016455_09000 [Aliiroseovarius zhejiangensis]